MVTGNIPRIPWPALLAKGFGGGILGNRRLAFKLCVPRVELVGAPQNQARSFSTNGAGLPDLKHSQLAGFMPVGKRFD